MWHVTQEMYETGFLSDVSHIATELQSRDSRHRFHNVILNETEPLSKTQHGLEKAVAVS